MKCPNCGANIKKEMEYCEYCNSYLRIEKPQAEEKTKVIIREKIVERVIHEPVYKQPTSHCNRWIAFVLCLLLGCFGAHRFYVRKIGTGILWMLTGGMFGIGCTIDAIVLLCGAFRDKDGLKLS